MVLAKDFDYLETLRAVIRSYLPDGYPSARRVSSLMGTSVRTLARRLSGHGLTYRAVVDEVRFNLAKKLLSVTGTRISDVACEVGFDDPAHFARMFRRVGGVTPREFRRVVSERSTRQPPDGPRPSC